jgi:hypothetical protein
MTLPSWSVSTQVTGPSETSSCHVAAGERANRGVATRFAEAAEHDQLAGAVGLQIAERGDVLAIAGGGLGEAGEIVARGHRGGVEGDRLVGARDGARAGVDDQLLAGGGIGDAGIAQRHLARLVTVRFAVEQIALELDEIVPAGLLVGEVDGPLDRGDAGRIEGQLGALRILIADDVDPEQGALPPHGAAAILELADADRHAVLILDVAVAGAFDRQRADRVRRDVEAVATVAETGDSDRRTDYVARIYILALNNFF